MSDRTRMENDIRNLEAIRRGYFEESERMRSEADRVSRDRNRAPSVSQILEHQQRCDQRADELRLSADRALVEAENILVQIRGLESHLRSLR
jgi:hypothetical protein